MGCGEFAKPWPNLAQKKVESLGNNLLRVRQLIHTNPGDSTGNSNLKSPSIIPSFLLLLLTFYPVFRECSGTQLPRAMEPGGPGGMSEDLWL